MTGDFVNRASTGVFNVGVRPAFWVEKNGVTDLRQFAGFCGNI